MIKTTQIDLQKARNALIYFINGEPYQFINEKYVKLTNPDKITFRKGTNFITNSEPVIIPLSRTSTTDVLEKRLENSGILKLTSTPMRVNIPDLDGSKDSTSIFKEATNLYNKYKDSPFTEACAFFFNEGHLMKPTRGPLTKWCRFNIPTSVPTFEYQKIDFGVHDYSIVIDQCDGHYIKMEGKLVITEPLSPKGTTYMQAIKYIHNLREDNNYE